MGRDFICPIDCLAGIGEVFGGQYPLNFQFTHAPVILDIGANVGAFTVACLQRWPEAQVHAYEPEPEIYVCLVGNVAGLSKVRCHEGAVCAGGGMRMFLEGRDNRLCGSIVDCGRQAGVGREVRALNAELLPKADLIKIDTEGAEVEIVRGLVRSGNIPSVLIVEFHTDALRRGVEEMVSGTNLELVHATVMGRGWGVNVYAAVKDPQMTQMDADGERTEEGALGDRGLPEGVGQ